MGFSQWNERLLTTFFGEFASGQPIRLSISGETLNSEFADLGGVGGLLRAIRVGPEWPAKYSNTFGGWVDPHTFTERALGLHRQWQHKFRRHSKYSQPPFDGPPYLPYLAILCYAWTVELDGAAGNNFYDRLESVCPLHGLRHNLNQLTPLWEGLQEWSESHKGELGIFRVEQLGGMQWVGIPKSQVIFTANRLERLPYLFADLALDPASPPSASALRQELLSRELLTRQYLGSSVVDSIRRGDGIGEAAVIQVLEHLDSWDGQLAEADEATPVVGTNGVGGAASHQGRLLLSLYPHQENEGWELGLHVAADGLPNGLVSLLRSGREWHATLLDGLAGPLRGDAAGDAFPAAVLLGCEEPCTAKLKWADDVDGEANVQAFWQPREVIPFRWRGHSLVELAELPADGDVYVFTTVSRFNQLANWLRLVPSHRRPALTSDLPQLGIPEQWRLVHLSDVGKLTDSEWAAFPGADQRRRLRPKLLTLRGGTRARRNGIRRVYVAYDPPRVVLHGAQNIQVTASGAKLEELITEHRQPNWLKRLNGDEDRVLRVIPSTNSAVVTLAASRSGLPTERATFAVVRSADDVEPTNVQPLSLNRFGEPSADMAGAVGPHVPGDCAPWSYFAGPYSDWDTLVGVPDCDRPGNLFLEWLSTQGTVPFSRARDFLAEQLASKGLWNSPNREARALWLLGHVEVGTDTRGRWKAVHPVSPLLYPLPLTRDKTFQVILGGTYTRPLAERVISAARARGLKVELRPNCASGLVSYYVLPPRICLLCSSLTDAESVAADAGVAWTPIPPAWRYAHFADTLPAWREKTATYAEGGPLAEATYRPCDFRTRDGDHSPPWGDCKLARFEDRVTRRHFQYTLICRRGADVRHAFVSQRAWATWCVHHDVMCGLWRQLFGQEGAFCVPIAYDTDSRAVVVPFELEPPLVLARALVLSSGEVPEVVGPTQYSAYADVANGFTPGQGYDGRCLRYPQIAPPIAELVLSKLCARVQAYPPLPALDL